MNMDTKNIHIFSGKEAANHVKGKEEALGKLALYLPNTVNRIRELMRDGKKDAAHLAYAERTAELGPKFEAGRGAVALDQKNIIGMAHFDYLGRYKGRPVFEIGGVVVHPKYRKGHLSSPLRKECLRGMLAKDSAAFSIGRTKEEKLIAKYEEWILEGFCEEVQGDVYEDIKDDGQDKSPLTDERTREDAKTWQKPCRIFIVDLQKMFSQK